MPFEFVWEDEAKTVVRYVAEGRWNWNDYHKIVRISTFSFESLDHKVEAVVDLRGGDGMPAGAVGHVRMMGKPSHRNRTARAIVLGVPPEVQRALGAVDGVAGTPEQQIVFVEDDDAVRSVLAGWGAE
jgi:hypothetical protein